MIGFVYAIRCADRVKIGWSSDPVRRFGKIESDSPFECERLGYWPGSMDDESAVHKRFADIRMHREWFAATPPLMAFIEQMAMPVRQCRSTLVPNEDDGPLALWRKAEGLSQAEAAEKLGTRRETVLRWEKCKPAIPLHRLDHVASVTGLEKAKLRPDLIEMLGGAA